MTLIQWILKLLGVYKPHNDTTTTTTSIPETTTETTTQIGGKKMKKAFCFSINDYPGTANDLSGCNSDSQHWSDLFKNTYGFEVERICDSLDTRSTVINTMTNLIANSKPGDVLVFSYSGHGTSIQDTHNDEMDGRDEAICLWDGLLLDDNIRDILNKLPVGVKCTFIADSCFSGTVTRAFLTTMNDTSYVSKPRYMPPQDNMEAIKLSGLPSLRAFAYPEEGMNHILLSGASDAEYSYDTDIEGPTGAFSYYAIKILKETPHITYNDFYKKLRTYLPCSQYPQTPQLEGSEENKNSFMFE